MSALSERPFRFGVSLRAHVSRADWVAKCRRAEALGFDVVCVSDHIGMPPPFPALVLAAEATERVRLCPFVLNAAFYNPTLLARETAGTDRLVDGRLEIGLGAGYVKAEFDTAGLPFPGAGARIDHLEHTVTRLRHDFAETPPAPAQRPGPPLLLGGNGGRMLGLAAREADIVGFTGISFGREGTTPELATAEELDERVALVREIRGAGTEPVEHNVLVQRVEVTHDRRAALEEFAGLVPDRTVDELTDLPILLLGTPADIAEQMRAHRDRYGIGYFTVREDTMEAFAPVIELLC